MPNMAALQKMTGRPGTTLNHLCPSRLPQDIFRTVHCCQSKPYAHPCEKRCSKHAGRVCTTWPAFLVLAVLAMLCSLPQELGTFSITEECNYLKPFSIRLFKSNFLHLHFKNAERPCQRQRLFTLCTSCLNRDSFFGTDGVWHWWPSHLATCLA